MRAEAMCSRAEYSAAEVRNKLRQWGLSQSQAERVVDDLLEGRYIDDARFARAFVSDKVEYARWGVKKIVVALMRRGVDRDTIEEALEGIDQERYSSNIVELIRQKARSVEAPRSYEGRGKILRFMLSRGYESARVVKILNALSLWDGDEC